MHGEWTKAALINRVARCRQYRSYLEICSLTAGNRYGEIDRSILRNCSRLMYWKPDGHSDGMRVDFAASGLDTTECIREIRARHLRFDIILVDPWHEYDTSIRDLGDALRLLKPGGTIVVHDCLPPSEELASPTYRVGDWCGVTYKAYLDFVTARPEIEYRTVDIDFGCGVIRARPPREQIHPTGECAALIAQWNALGDDFGAAYRFMQAHKRMLCRLQSIEDFIRDEEAASVELRPHLRGAAD
jgi:hypothetical protein